jgi:hypothetical protein
MLFDRTLTYAQEKVGLLDKLQLRNLSGFAFSSSAYNFIHSFLGSCHHVDY